MHVKWIIQSVDCQLSRVPRDLSLFRVKLRASVIPLIIITVLSLAVIASHNCYIRVLTSRLKLWVMFHSTGKPYFLSAYELHKTFSPPPRLKINKIDVYKRQTLDALVVGHSLHSLDDWTKKSCSPWTAPSAAMMVWRVRERWLRVLVFLSLIHI